MVKGGSRLLQFDLTKVFLSYGNTVFHVEIYKGNSDIVSDQDNPTLVESREYPGIDFASSGAAGVNWVADNRYPVGDYTLIAYTTQDGYLSDDSVFLVDLHVLSAPQPATDIALACMDDDYNFYRLESPIVLTRGERIRVAPVLRPVANTTERQFTMKGWDTNIISVDQMNMSYYPVISAIRVGVTDLIVDYGTIKKTYQVVVTLDGLNVRLTPSRTSLCPGDTDTVTAAYTQTNAYGTSVSIAADMVRPAWYSSNSAVVSVKDGVVTAEGPGTANVTIVAGAATHTVQYTVHPHDLPADAPAVANTATRPGYTEGACSLCGRENARNYTSPVFTDTQADAWYADAVDYVYANTLMNGTGAHTYRPQGAVTRAQMVTILNRVAGAPETAYAGAFTDVPAGTWYTQAVEWAAANSIINGIAEGRFGPEGEITRQQIAAILYRYCDSPAVDGSLEQFPDADTVGPYAHDAMIWATSVGLINGVKSGDTVILAPRNTATRAQIAVIIQRLCENVLPAQEQMPEGR